MIFKGPSWVGYVGMLTGIKPDAFSVSVNFRISDGFFFLIFFLIFFFSFFSFFFCLSLKRYFLG